MDDDDGSDDGGDGGDDGDGDSDGSDSSDEGGIDVKGWANRMTKKGPMEGYPDNEQRTWRNYTIERQHEGVTYRSFHRKDPVFGHLHNLGFPRDGTMFPFNFESWKSSRNMDRDTSNVFVRFAGKQFHYHTYRLVAFLWGAQLKVQGEMSDVYVVDHRFSETAAERNSWAVNDLCFRSKAANSSKGDRGRKGKISPRNSQPREFPPQKSNGFPVNNACTWIVEHKTSDRVQWPDMVERSNGRTNYRSFGPTDPEFGTFSDWSFARNGSFPYNFKTCKYFESQGSNIAATATRSASVRYPVIQTKRGGVKRHLQVHRAVALLWGAHNGAVDGGGNAVLMSANLEVDHRKGGGDKTYAVDDLEFLTASQNAKKKGKSSNK